MNVADAEVGAVSPGAMPPGGLAAALAALPDPVFIQQAVRDADGTIVELRYAFLNEAAARLLGLPIEAVLGQELSRLFPSVRALGIFDTYVSVIDSGSPASFAVPQFQENDVEGAFWLTAVRFGDGVLVSARDITEQQRAQHALAETSQRYRMLADNASDVLIQGTPQSVITWVSSSVTSFLGWRPEEMVGRSAFEFAHPDDRPALRATVVRLGPGESFNGRMRLRCLDGSYRWMSRTWRPVADDSGTVVAHVAGFRDIQAEVDTEQALARSEERYRLVAENATDFVMLTRTDGAIEWVSPAVTRTMGWSPDELLGTRMADLLHPDDRAATAAARALVYAGHEVTTATGGFVVRMRTRAGGWRWMSGCPTPVADDAGVPIGAVGGWKDVDDLVHARQAAQADRDHLRATLDSLLDPHVLLKAVRDQAGQIVDFVYVDANPAACAYNHLDYQDLVGARLLDVLPGHAGSDILESYRRVVDTGEPLVADDVGYAHDLLGGAPRRYDTRGSRVEDGLSLTWRDVTDRHLAQEKREQFLSHVSHELRSPLAVVHQFGSLLADEVGGPLTAEQQEFLAVIMRNVGQLRVMIDDLLEVSRAGTGRLKVDCRALAIGDVLAEATAGYKRSAEDRGVAVRVDCGDLPLVIADAERLHEVLTNLLDNALKFTPRGGEVTVDAIAQGDLVRVSVRDTGCGIAAQDQDHIFEQFYQVAQRTQASRGGLGLGLYLCRNLIEQQGGTIWAASTPGAGTTVFFTVPTVGAPSAT